jgi:hypothetical protein
VIANAGKTTSRTWRLTSGSLNRKRRLRTPAAKMSAARTTSTSSLQARSRALGRYRPWLQRASGQAAA